MGTRRLGFVPSLGLRGKSTMVRASTQHGQSPSVHPDKIASAIMIFGYNDLLSTRNGSVTNGALCLRSAFAFAFVHRRYAWVSSPGLFCRKSLCYEYVTDRTTALL